MSGTFAGQNNTTKQISQPADTSSPHSHTSNSFHLKNNSNLLFSSTIWQMSIINPLIMF